MNPFQTNSRLLLLINSLFAIGVAAQAQQDTSIPEISYENVAYGEHSKQRAVVNEISIINHITSDDPPTYMSYGMHPDDSIPKDPKRARGWSIHHVKFGLVMEGKLRQEGVEVHLKFPRAQVRFKDDVAFLIHHLKK